MLTNYILDRQNGSPWDLDDIYALQGKISYYRSIEKTNIDSIISHYNSKFGISIIDAIKTDIKNYQYRNSALMG